MQPNNPSPPSVGQPYNQPSPSSRRRLNYWMIVTIVLGLLVLGLMALLIKEMSDVSLYKDKSDTLVAAAVIRAKQDVSTEKDKEFVEKEKLPTKTYQGPAVSAGVSFSYPKTWAGYISESTQAVNELDGYIHPNFVPNVQSGTAFAIRFQLVNETYDQQLRAFEAKTKQGKVSVAPFTAAKVPAVLGARVTGEINIGQKDTMVLLPIRDKTLKIWTESDQFVPDLNQIVLASLTFVP